ncbi:unnamed protein product [Effrenium voratum]|uniref:Uncharacterized protein n=1 Tax=Effrenium voratum TaxID=2562239 RepID=A0AA36MYL7_9DINO|nr:unnamed protein product [Effrenium voratum]
MIRELVKWSRNPQSRRAVATKYLQLVRSVLRLEPHIPEVVPLRCAGLRRMASACAVFGALALLLLLGGCDLLGLMATSQDFLAASASGGLLGLLGLSTLAQFLQHLVLIIFQVVVAASAQMRYEVYGLFDHRCGYLVGSSDLDTASCPNAWHVPVDALAMVMLVFGFIMCFVLVWLLPFRRFVDAPAARWTVVLVRRALRRSYLTGERKAPRTPAPLWPLSALLVSLGVWPEPVAELEQISGRLEWLLPQEKEEEEAPGASWDFASWRSGALGVAQLYALCWVPLPGIGPVMCKFGLYLNRRVIFAFSRDGPSEAEPSVTFESTKAREEGSLRQLALQDIGSQSWGCWQQGFRAKAYERFHSTVKVPMDAFVQLGET